MNVDRNMALVILHAFSTAAFECQSSLVMNENGKPCNNIPSEQYIEAEFRVLQELNKKYPELVYQYFDVDKQIMKNHPSKTHK